MWHFLLFKESFNVSRGLRRRTQLLDNIVVEIEKVHASPPPHLHLPRDGRKKNKVKPRAQWALTGSRQRKESLSGCSLHEIRVRSDGEEEENTLQKVRSEKNKDHSSIVWFVCQGNNSEGRKEGRKRYRRENEASRSPFARIRRDSGGRARKEGKAWNEYDDYASIFDPLAEL